MAAPRCRPADDVALTASIAEPYQLPFTVHVNETLRIASGEGRGAPGAEVRRGLMRNPSAPGNQPRVGWPLSGSWLVITESCRMSARAVDADRKTLDLGGLVQLLYLEEGALLVLEGLDLASECRPSAGAAREGHC